MVSNCDRNHSLPLCILRHTSPCVFSWDIPKSHCDTDSFPLSRCIQNKAAQPPRRWSIVKGDTVEIINGPEKGKRGKVLRKVMDRGTLLVEGVRMVRFDSPRTYFWCRLCAKSEIGVTRYDAWYRQTRKTPTVECTSSRPQFTSPASRSLIPSISTG